jgi:hypothetical protein
MRRKGERKGSRGSLAGAVRGGDGGAVADHGNERVVQRQRGEEAKPSSAHHSDKDQIRLSLFLFLPPPRHLHRHYGHLYYRTCDSLSIWSRVRPVSPPPSQTPLIAILSHSYSKFFASGAACCLLSHGGMVPIDVVKTRMQVRSFFSLFPPLPSFSRANPSFFHSLSRN